MSRWVWPVAVGLLACPVRADDRGTERLRYECSSQLGRRDVTLFANGTVRLRQGTEEEPRLDLLELGRDELASVLEALGRVDPTDDRSAPGRASSLAGAWIERCSIVVTLPDRPVERYDFAELDVAPLRVAQLVHVAEDLARRARPEVSARRLPGDYQPVRGHVVANAQGQRFRVKGLTGDLRGVELDGVDQPLTIFVSRENLLLHFFAVSEPEPP